MTRTVSVVVPMLNEQEHIHACLEGLAIQTYGCENFDVIVVDGGSSDGCRRVVEEWTANEPWIRIVDNHKRKAAAAFNVGTEVAKGEIVCLMSSHGVPGPAFVERAVAVLEETGAAGVGGKVDHYGADPVSTAIGLAMMSPFGMASGHRYANARQDVDTISHPVYWREALVEVGLFNETLERNSDYELNWRLRAAGRRLVFDPSIESVYRPRKSRALLAKQFWFYGRWKARVARAHPRSIRPRHLAAPIAAAGALLSPALLPTRRGRRVLAAGAVTYGALATFAAVLAEPRKHGADPVVLVSAFPVMHLAWGMGFLRSFVEDLVTR